MEVEENELALEVVVGGGYQLQIKQDPTQINEVLNMDEVVGVVESIDHNEIGSGANSPCSFPWCTSSGQVVEVNASNMSATEIVIEEVMREQKEISEIMYLNEYIGWRGDQSIEDA